MLSYTYSKKTIAIALFLASILLGYLLYTYRSYVRTALKKGLLGKYQAFRRIAYHSTLPCVLP